MRQVLYALLPALLIYVALFGWGVVINCLLAAAFALGFEAVMLALRAQPLRAYLGDGTAVVTAVLLGLSLPPFAPWWTTLVGVLFAVVIVKHLYGGTGHNVFNPAMAGLALLLVCFPAELNLWPAVPGAAHAATGLLDSAWIIFTGHPYSGTGLDALSGATPLGYTREQLRLMHTMTELHGGTLFGTLGGRGWEWVNLGYLAGGLWLVYRRVVRWHIPVSFLAALALSAAAFYLLDPDTHASPVFHLFTGASMLGAFFIVTDPVTAPASPRGRLIFGALVGVLTYVIRAWSSYPDGLAFAVLIMNAAAPTIDHYTRPRVLGEGR